MAWDYIATVVGLKRCKGCDEGDHREGWARGSTVHWEDRRSTRAGIRKFLMLAASLRILGFAERPEWERLYMANVWANRMGLQLHTRIPARLSANDRARVRYLATKNDIPLLIRQWARRDTND